MKHLANPMVLTGAWESQVMTVFFSYHGSLCIDAGIGTRIWRCCFDNFLYTFLEASACSGDIWLVAGLRLPAGYALAEPFCAMSIRIVTFFLLFG